MSGYWVEMRARGLRLAMSEPGVFTLSSIESLSEFLAAYSFILPVKSTSNRFSIGKSSRNLWSSGSQCLKVIEVEFKNYNHVTLRIYMWKSSETAQKSSSRVNIPSVKTYIFDISWKFRIILRWCNQKTWNIKCWTCGFQGVLYLRFYKIQN